MVFFHIDKQRRLKNRIKERLHFAHYLKNHFDEKDHLPANHERIMKSISIAESDESAFKKLFNEPMPQQLKKGLQVELGMWIYLRNILDRLSTGELSDNAFKEKASKLKGYLKLLVRTIEIEIEILYSPLVYYYERELSAISRRI